MQHNRNDGHIFSSGEWQLNWIVNFIRLYAVDKGEYAKVTEQIASTLRFDEPRLHSIRNGEFEIDDLFKYLRKIEPEKNHDRPIGFITHFTERLKNHRVIFDNNYANGFDDYRMKNTIHLNRKVIAQYVEWNCLENAYFGVPQLLQKYSDAIFHIKVVECKEDHNGKKGDHCGSGFAMKYLDASGEHIYAITNKHVIQPGVCELTEIVNGSGASIEFKEPIYSKKYDLCAVELVLPSTNSIVPFSAFPNSYVLERIVVIGFPNISRVCNPVQLIQSGEINGFTDTYDGEKLMIMSAPVAPGSSGGPVLNSLGLVVGVTVQSNEAEYLSHKTVPSNEDKIMSRNTVHYCAIPSHLLMDFMGTELSSIHDNSSS